LTAGPRIITDNISLSAHYDDLQAGDIICSRVRIRPGEEHLLLDLCRRGVIAVPSLISQLCSRSKTLQARLCPWAMLPATRVIYTVHDLLDTLNLYSRERIGEVVVKLDNRNSGLGIFRYRSLEDVYTQSGLGQLPYPYVVQPFLDGCRDLRVIALDDYWEAYERFNPDNFRQNLHCGGQAVSRELTNAQRDVCSRVMKQLDFPYAHIDLLITEDADCYLSELNLRGGLRGAKIAPEDYQRRVSTIDRRWCEKITGGKA
jgi:glutathione synthase/RimK-type ligase-like ATP-grasp enzyme